MPVSSSRSILSNFIHPAVKLSNLIDSMKLPFQDERELRRSFYSILGVYPHDLSLYKLATLHASALERGAKGGKPLNNERLEFLGDAILDAVVGDIVYTHFQGKREGFLTNARSKMVQRETLGKVAQETGLMRLIRRDRRAVSAHNSYMGGNAFEALVGALYLDQGYEACKTFFQEQILGRYINMDKLAYQEMNYKSKLLEWGQKFHMEITFDVQEHKEGNTTPVFLSDVFVGGEKKGSGKGYSKKESQQNACREAVARLRTERFHQEKEKREQ